MRSASSLATTACGIFSTSPFTAKVWRYKSRLGRDDIQRTATAPALSARSRMAGPMVYSFVRSSHVTRKFEWIRTIASFAAAPALAKPASSPMPASITSALMPPSGVAGDPPMGNRGTGKGRGGKIFEMRVTFEPADGNVEFFGMDVVNTGVTKSLNSPIRGAVGRGRTGDSAADGVAEVAKIFFKGRGTECRLNHGGCQIGTGFLNRARTRALRRLR